MERRIKLGRLFDVELGLHYSWIIVAFLVIFSLAANFHAIGPDWSGATVWSMAAMTAALFFMCLLAHELSHALVARARGIPIRRITLFVFGGVAEIGEEAHDATSEFLMAIVGPLSSGIIGGVLLGLATLAGWKLGVKPLTPITAELVWLGFINLGLAAFNLVPAFPMDGGRVLHAAIWHATGSGDRSGGISSRIGQFIAAGFIAIGMVAIFSGDGFSGLWLAAIGWLLFEQATATAARLRSKELLKGLRVSDLMSSGPQVIDGAMTIRDLVDHMLRSRRNLFLVTRGNAVIGIITPHEVLAVPRSEWEERQVQDAVQPLSTMAVATPDEPVVEALKTMLGSHVAELPVLSGSLLEGAISQSDILKTLRIREQFTNVR
jgi:Zn-dependent protease/predicted transcriptional regulator